MKVYVLVSDIYGYGFGCELVIRGIFSTKEKAIIYCKENNILYQEVKNNESSLPYYYDRLFVTTLDTDNALNLGGYCE